MGKKIMTMIKSTLCILSFVLFPLSGCGYVGGFARGILVPDTDPNRPRSVPYTTMLQDFVGKPAATLNQYLGEPRVQRGGEWKWGEERWVMAKFDDSNIGPDLGETLNRDVCQVTATLDDNDIITSIYYEEDIKKRYSVLCPPIINIQNYYYGKERMKEISTAKKTEGTRKKTTAVKKKHTVKSK